jgi:hypothetical protein
MAKSAQGVHEGEEANVNNCVTKRGWRPPVFLDLQYVYEGSQMKELGLEYSGGGR